jgi:hypothetical protein
VINLCFSSCQLSCASFAINIIKDPTEVGNVIDSDLYTDSPVGISFDMFFIDVDIEDKLPCCAQAMTGFA